MKSQFTKYSASVAVIAGFALCGPVFAAPPDVVITDAKIAAGRLAISGKAATAGMKLRLDGKMPASFNAVSRFDKSFSLSVVYLPRDCIVSVQKVLPDGQLGASNDVVVANCAPSVIAPRGTWSAAATYEMTDVVAYKGASWLATQDNVNKVPGASASWQLFAAGAESDTAGNTKTSDTAATDQSASRAARAASSDAAAQAIPSGAAGGDLAGTYPDPEIRSLAVTTDKIAPLAVGNAKIKDGAIAEAKILDGAVTGVKIGVDAVTRDKVLDDTQPGGGLASADLAANSVTASELAIDSVNASEIADNSIDSGEIVNNSLGGSDIADGSITGIDIAASTITGAKIADSSIGSADIASNSLTSSDFAGGLATGNVGFGAGSVPNGQCRQVNIAVAGAEAGDVPIIAWRANVQDGVFLYGTRVASTSTVEAVICNFSGAAMAAITNIPVRLITLR